MYYCRLLCRSGRGKNPTTFRSPSVHKMPNDSCLCDVKGSHKFSSPIATCSADILGVLGRPGHDLFSCQRHAILIGYYFTARRFADVSSLHINERALRGMWDFRRRRSLRFSPQSPLFAPATQIKHILLVKLIPTILELNFHERR